MAVDMGVEGAEDWTKVEPDIDDVISLEGDTVLEDDDDDEDDECEDVEEEDETGQAMNSSGGKFKTILSVCMIT
jgi:mitogen-activated protein kinase kinase kinase